MGQLKDKKSTRSAKQLAGILAGASPQQRAEMKAISKVMHEQTVTVPNRNKAKKVSKGKPGQSGSYKTRPLRSLDAKQIMKASGPLLNARLEAYFRSLANPWQGQSVRCPVNYNPVPSFGITTATTTSTLSYISVAANTTAQFTLFPGHGQALDSDSMDGVSYHATSLAINATNYAIGPMTSGALAAAVGAITTGLGGNVDVVSFATAASSPIQADTALPFTASTANGGHTRWKLVSMGLRFENMTAISSRGGNILYVQPLSLVQATGNLLTDYAAQPTFTETVDANLGSLNISWIPRPEDLAFWHSEAAAASYHVNAGIIVWVQNPTPAAQNYMFEGVYNWELSGASLAALATPTVHQPMDKNVVEPALSVMKFTKSTADSALSIAREVGKTISPFVELGSTIAHAVAPLFA